MTMRDFAAVVIPIVSGRFDTIGIVSHSRVVRRHMA
jgi:hypothetical protein